MLVVIFECILESRLPVYKGIRGSRSDLDKIEVMKIFLGVLETDIIKMVVGMGDIHPRAVPRGEELETVFVGELLCQLGQKSGILPLGYEGAIPRQSEAVVMEERTFLAKRATTPSRRPTPAAESEQRLRPLRPP